ncbi:MAG: hypothetical protein HYU36_25575 [Planctomycetes bacterium]|nr:hypothetical protein [Planctomycetota bacterium]
MVLKIHPPTNPYSEVLPHFGIGIRVRQRCISVHRQKFFASRFARLRREKWPRPSASAISSSEIRLAAELHKTFYTPRQGWAGEAWPTLALKYASPKGAADFKGYWIDERKAGEDNLGTTTPNFA